MANIPGDSVDDGEVVFDLLFPLVLPEGNGDHRYVIILFKSKVMGSKSNLLLNTGKNTHSSKPDTND